MVEWIDKKQIIAPSFSTQAMTVLSPEAAAHTAEHVFMKALTERIDVRPLLVQQGGWSGKIIVRGEEPTWPVIADALVEANLVIMEGRRVLIHVFEDIEGARAEFPELRAYEERIKPPVRVVEVEGYDWAACIRDHAENTRESWGIIVDGLSSLSGGRYELSFHAGPDAVRRLALILRELGISVRKLNTSIESLSEAVGALVDKADELKLKVRSLGRSVIDGYSTVKAASGKPVRMIRAGALNIKDVVDKAVKTATATDTCIIVISRDDDLARVLLACPKGSQYNIGSLMRSMSSAVGGMGGGGMEAAIGSVSWELIDSLVERILSEL